MIRRPPRSTLFSLHDALPISPSTAATPRSPPSRNGVGFPTPWPRWMPRDRKSTRLNSSHGYISYAVFCLKKKKTNLNHPQFLDSISSTPYIYHLPVLCIHSNH